MHLFVDNVSFLRYIGDKEAGRFDTWEDIKEVLLWKTTAK